MSYHRSIDCMPIGKQCHCDRCLTTARRVYREFHRRSAPTVLRARCRRMIPPLLVHIGELRGLIYRSERERQGVPQTYIHFMKTPAQLTCDPQGRQLYILGGRYRVTRRGIEG